jgi:hypothetical protein
MNIFNNRGDISYYAVGLVHLERGLFTREKIEELKNELSPLEFIKDIDVCNDYNIIAERWKLIDEVKCGKPVRGQRRNANLYEESAGNFTSPTYIGNFEEKKEDIEPIDFKSLINREEDKKKVIYGLFDEILETNLEGIKEALGNKYVVNIQYNKSKANTLYIADTDVLNRCCYIKYENINPNKNFGYTKEEIEEYLQKIVVAFAMEYDE